MADWMRTDSGKKYNFFLSVLFLCGFVEVSFLWYNQSICYMQGCSKNISHVLSLFHHESTVRKYRKPKSMKTNNVLCYMSPLNNISRAGPIKYHDHG